MLSLEKATVLMGTKRTIQFQDSVEAGGQLGDCLTLSPLVWGQRSGDLEVLGMPV